MKHRLAPSLLLQSTTRALGITLAASILCAAMFPFFALSNLSMIYLLGVTFAAARYGKMESILVSLFSILAMDFLFVPPRFSFVVSNDEFVITFIVMLVVSAVIGDLTSRVKQQAQIVSERERKVESERLHNTLLSSISHDFRTPLSTITGAVTTMIERGNFVDSTQKELLLMVREQSERLARIVRNVLDMTRVDSESINLNREWQSLEELLGVALEHCDRILGDRNVTISLSEDLPLLHLDGVLFEQLIVNLLENVGRHTPPNARIVIRSQKVEEFVIFEIEDDGPGIAAGEEEKIFKKLYRISSNGSTGQGLGLAICRSIVLAHGGTIIAGRGELQGALFRISIPHHEMQKVIGV